jgi:hypothetical protein
MVAEVTGKSMILMSLPWESELGHVDDLIGRTIVYENDLPHGM